MIPVDYTEPVVVMPSNKAYSLSISTDLFYEGQLSDSSYLIQTIPVNFSNAENLSIHLNKLLELIDGWDGEDAIALYNESVSNCSKFLCRLPLEFIEKINPNDVYPTGHGTVVIDLINDENEKVSIEFGKTKIGFFSDFKDGNNYRLESEIFNYNNLPSDLISAVTQLFQIYIF